MSEGVYIGECLACAYLMASVDEGEHQCPKCGRVMTVWGKYLGEQWPVDPEHYDERGQP